MVKYRNGARDGRGFEPLYWDMLGSSEVCINCDGMQRGPLYSGTLLCISLTSEKALKSLSMSSTRRAAFHVKYAVNPTVFLDSCSIGLEWDLGVTFKTLIKSFITFFLFTH